MKNLRKVACDFKLKVTNCLEFKHSKRERVSRDTREGGTSEESWALRDSYCMEKHFCYVCTRGWGIRSPRAKKWIVFDQSVCHVCIPLCTRRWPVSRHRCLAAILTQRVYEKSSVVTQKAMFKVSLNSRLIQKRVFWNIAFELLLRFKFAKPAPCIVWCVVATHARFLKSSGLFCKSNRWKFLWWFFYILKSENLWIVTTR